MEVKIIYLFFFFFQAEDGIRDSSVTGVQTCALPISTHLMEEAERCDRLAILNEGKLVALGTPVELKQEIGGDVIVLDAKDPESLATRIRGRFEIEVRVVDGQIRIEKSNSHRFVTDLVEAFPGEIDAVSIAKPSLDEQFIRRI